MKLSGRLLVDMDSTLYYAPFSEACRVLWGADCPLQSSSWLWYKDYMSKKQWRETINFVHDRQAFYPPFPEAPQTLAWAKEYFRIIVTSQRPENKKGTVNWWLAQNGIPADETIISPEPKTFKQGDIVIDDAPHNIVEALKCGAHAITLRYPYNQHTKRLGAVRVDDWKEIGEYLKGMNRYGTREQ